jgi:hypothetical protein
MKIKTTIYIFQSQYPWDDAEKYDVYSVKLGDAEHRTYVGSQEIEIEVPDYFDPRPQQIAALEKEKQLVMAESQQAVTKINHRINNLKAITA